LADDALGLAAAEALWPLKSDAVDIVASAESGLRLLDYLLGVSRVVVVDSVHTGKAEPGTVYVLTEDDVGVMRGGSPHYVGLFEALALARKLDLPAADEMMIIAVEISDGVTVGGPMHPAVRTAIKRVVRIVEKLVD
jgi:hydrogenase maturation protease